MAAERVPVSSPASGSPATDFRTATRSGLTATTHPVVRIVRIKQMLDPAAYRRIRHNLFRVHCQFVSANDRRAAYDYFMLLCGPLSVPTQVALPEGAASEIGLNGELLAPAPHDTAARERQAQAGE